MMIGVGLILVVFLGLFSPGPNVILLTSSAAQFGFRATLPHMLGVVIGVGMIGFTIGLGVGAILLTFPALSWALRIIAMGWIWLLAYQLWAAADPTAAKQQSLMNLREAVLSQWVNPKVWAVAIAASAFLSVGAPIIQGITLGAVMSSVNLFVCIFWTSFGHMLSRFVSAGRPQQVFLRIMAILLALSGLLVLL